MHGERSIGKVSITEYSNGKSSDKVKPRENSRIYSIKSLLPDQGASNSIFLASINDSSNWSTLSCLWPLWYGTSCCFAIKHLKIVYSLWLGVPLNHNTKHWEFYLMNYKQLYCCSEYIMMPFLQDLVPCLLTDGIHSATVVHIVSSGYLCLVHIILVSSGYLMIRVSKFQLGFLLKQEIIVSNQTLAQIPRFLTKELEVQAKTWNFVLMSQCVWKVVKIP